MEKVALRFPAGMVTDAGTVTRELLAFRLTSWPPGGAKLSRVAVMVSDPRTGICAGAGLSVTIVSSDAVTLKAVLVAALSPLPVAFRV